MWRRFDAGEIREDFARIALLGLDSVRIFLTWAAFQPEADRVDAAMLDRFATVLALAADAKLRVLAVLFTGNHDGANDLPAWTLDRTRPHGRVPTIVDGVASPFGIGDMYRGPLLDAQRMLARALAAAVRDHPALHAWDIGHAFADVREPSHVKVTAGEHSTEPADERDVARWAKAVADALHESSSRPVTAGTTAADLTEDRNVRFGTLCAPFGFASMQGDTTSLAFARSRLDPEAIPFLAALTGAFSYKPVLVTAFGNPTCPPGKFTAFERVAAAHESPNATISPDDTVFATYPCLSEDENAAYCTDVLERLHADGHLGAYWRRWSDDDADANDARAGSYGILRRDGSEKPVAAALSAFAARRRDVVRADEMTMIAATYYYRTLPTSTKTLYDGFLRFARDRRTTRERT